MALNLITLTTAEGERVELNPAHIVSVETASGKSKVTDSTGKAWTFTDPQAKIRERCNARAPDGF